MKRLFLAPLFGVLALAGCSSDAGPSAETPVVRSGAVALIAPPFKFTVSRLGDSAEPGATDVAFLRVVGQASAPSMDPKMSWQEADARSRAALDAYDGLYRSHIEQVVAGWMLNVRLFQQPRTPEVVAATDYYTELLVDHRAVDAATMARALDILAPAWGAARVAEVASQAHDDAVTDLTSKGALCTDAACGIMQASDTPLHKFDVQDVAAVGTLLRLAS